MKKFASELWERMALGYPEHGVRYDAMEFTGWAESCGGLGIKIERLKS